jgi:hydroxymethylpyrimidine/phosphomethylpyrimidine kinase/hydroxymethylpyrimidine kinase/phosphomethylpyrimidine kinase/thiamine-phosphate diphosphorylase
MTMEMSDTSERRHMNASLHALEVVAEKSSGAPSRARVLSIEGSDPIGGAGTMADMKVFTAHGVYGYAVMTSVLAQNTQGVTDIVNMEPGFIRAQLDAVSDDSDIDSMKIGMLGTVEIIDVVREWLSGVLERAAAGEIAKPFVVIDPVMYAKSSDALLTPEAEQALRSVLPLADVITPNIPELAALTDSQPASSWDGMVDQARDLASAMNIGVYAKSGMLTMKGASDASDVLVMPGDTGDEPLALRIPGHAISTSNVHGTGDSLSSSLAALRPQKSSWSATALAAKEWMTGAIAAADQLHVGKGHGPIDFTWKHAPTGLSFSSDYWNRVEPVRERIASMPFIEALLDGSLPRDAFNDYLHQDDLYLSDYTSLLALASSRADTIHERVFFAGAARGSVESELGLHRSWFLDNGYSPERARMSEVTAAYIGHEHRVADQGRYSTLAAVVMPCFWLYAEVGRTIASRAVSLGLDLDTHPYGSWIHAYADDSFNSAVAQEVAICNRVAAAASIDEYNEMMDAALISSEHEYRFFAQAGE